MRQDARPAMKAELSPGPIWLPLLPNTGSQPAVVAHFRFHLAACGALCEADNGAWLRQPDREVALAAALATMGK